VLGDPLDLLSFLQDEVLVDLDEPLLLRENLDGRVATPALPDVLGRGLAVVQVPLVVEGLGNLGLGLRDREPFELTGEFEERFDEGATGTFSFAFDEAFREEVVDGIEYLDEAEWGQPGALAPMSMMSGMGDMDDEEMDDEGMDMGSREFGTDTREAGMTELPPADDLPGELLGTPSSGDAVLATTLHNADSRFVEEGQYLSVSPRTPYNRGMLPMMTIDITVDREGEDEPVIDTQLTDSLDHEFGYHYTLRTAALENGEEIQDGDTITLSFPSPPQVSRHQGYETAFLDMEPVELTVSLS
jgi:hypothetical protein